MVKYVSKLSTEKEVITSFRCSVFNSLECTFDGKSGLFYRAIAQSGSFLEHWTFTRDPKQDAEQLGKLLGCSNVESGSLVECIKGASAT
ncbi:MAG: carboxylesterase family protein [Candidatus Thiodiazotropha sp.]